MQCDAVVGYGWCRASYVALRSLHRLGLRVAVADEYRAGMSQWSRFAAMRFRYAGFRAHPETFLDDIVRIVIESGARFYLPGHDEGELVARFRDRFPKEVIIPLHDHAILALANNKAETLRLATELEIPVPERIRYDEPEKLRGALDGATGPFVIKLLRSNSAKGVFYAPDASGTVAIVDGLIDRFQLSRDRLPIVQRRVSGEGWGVSCLYWQGEPVASFTHRRLREKTVTGGTSTLRESARNPALEEYARRMLTHLRWHGLAMVEFKWDPKSERGWFMEINPRLWGSIALPVACGVDFPALVYIAATQGAAEARKCVADYKTGIVARWYLGDVIRGVGRLVRFHPMDALRSVLPARVDLYDDLPFDDPGALAGQLAFYLTRFLGSASLNPVDPGMIG